MPEERWFSEEELEEISRPTMDRAIEAIDAGDVDAARRLCEEMKHEWRFLHDMMVEGIARPDPFVQERLGDDGVAEAWTSGPGRGWRARRRERSPQRDRRQIVLGAGGDLARALVQRHRSAPGSVHDRRGRREVHLPDEPVRLGAAAGGEWDATRVRTRSARHQSAHDWSYGRKGFPLYCTHCSFMNEITADPSGSAIRCIRAIRPTTSTAIRARGTGTRIRPTSPTGTGSATG